jgi:hypothetical protein
MLLPIEALCIEDKAVDNNVKTIIIITDSLDFSKIEILLENNKAALGLMNIKTGNLYRNNSEESFFITLALGKRVKVDKGLFKGIKRFKDEKLYVDGFIDIVQRLKVKYKDFSREMYLFGDYFKQNNIKVGYIGQDSSSLLAADKEGFIFYGETEVVYERKWLINKSMELLNDVDILVLSYSFNDLDKRVYILKEYINQFKENYIIVFPRKIDGDIDVRWNTALVPILYKTPESIKGILTSDTTKRKGVITNLDIFPSTASLYGRSYNMLIGNEISIVKNENPIIDIKNYLLEFLNLNILKYILHGVVILSQLYIIISSIMNRKKEKIFSIIMNSIIIGIFFSFVLGVFNIHRSIIGYGIGLIGISLALSVFFTGRINVLGLFSLLTSMTILYGIFFNRDIIYNSYIGYNNIVAGGRFYGLNNETMGVLLASSVVGFMYIKKYLNIKSVRAILITAYLLAVILSLSSRYGANIGGYLTAIGLLLVSIYICIYNKRINTGILLTLSLIGILVFGANIALDLLSIKKSHAGELIIRAKALGYNELLGFIIGKMKQFMFMVIIPPWSIIMIGQFYYLNRFYKKNKEKINDMKAKCPDLIRGCFIIFSVSIIALLVNDTGIISFTYMNTYLIGTLTGLHNIEKRDLF